MSVSFHIGILPNRPLTDFVDWIARAPVWDEIYAFSKSPR